MVNAMAQAMVAALDDTGASDPQQRLKALVAKLGVKGRPSRKDRRAVLSLARRFGVLKEDSEAPGRSWSPVLPIPPAAESVIRRWEQEQREMMRERFHRAVTRIRRSRTGREVTLRSKDQGAGSRALIALGALEVDPQEVDTETLAWAGRLTSAQIKYLFGRDAALLPEESAVRSTFDQERRRASIILKSRIKRPALEEGAEATPLTAPIAGVEVDEATARELVGDYTPRVAQRAAFKRAVKALLRQQAQGAFPPEPSGTRWERLAWLTIVSYGKPHPGRLKARVPLREELGSTRLTEGELIASLVVAQREMQHEQAQARIA